MAPSANAFHGTDRFSLIRRIGQGGMGVVYEAYDHERKLRVALKTMREIQPDAIYHFKQEFRSLAQISHPHLISLYELVSDGQQWFFTMELLDDALDLFSYLRGHSPSAEQPVWQQPAEPIPATDPAVHATTRRDLGNHDAASSPRGSLDPTIGLTREELEALQHSAESRSAASTQLDWDRVRGLFLQLARGVSALHQAGKLHRDLKPSNALVRGDGQVVLLDFGLIADLTAETTATPGAEFSGESTRLTHHPSDKSISGTLPYMSPEQMRNEPLTAASDWYAVGVMLFQTLTGRLPFVGRAADVLRAKVAGEAPNPAELVAGVPDDLNSLCRDLLRRDPAARPDGQEVLERLRAGAAEPPANSAQEVGPEIMPFVGREQELATLSAAFAPVLRGQLSVCYVDGRSGAGKSTLIQRFLDQVAIPAGAACLMGRCYEQESVPYKALDSLVDALTRYVLRQPQRDALLPPNVGALARVFPVLERIPTVAQAAQQLPGTSDPRQLRSEAFQSLRALLNRIARTRPLVLCIDDLQWGDPDSAVLIAELLRPPDPPPLLMLLSYRSEYAQTSSCLVELRTLEARLGLSRQCQKIVVDALSPQETRLLALTLLSAPGGTSCSQDEPARQAEWIVNESRGSAFFVYELVRHVRAGMTVASPAQVDLDQILWQRICRLPEEKRRLLECLAVAGQPSRLRYVQQAAGLPQLPPQVVSALRSEHLIRGTGPSLDDEIETFHDRIRESLVARLPEATRRQHHAAWVRTLECAGDGDVETLAVHCLEAGEGEKASGYFARAADQAVRVLAFDRAESFYEQAAQLAPSEERRAEIHEKMIHFYTDMARFHDAYEVARRGVRPFGVSLPRRFTAPLFLVDLVEAKWRLRGKTPSQLVDLPTMSDERLAAAVRLMDAVAKAAYQIRPELCVHVATKVVKLCLKHGNTPDSAVAYMVFGSIFQGGVRGDHPAGYEFGRLALSLVEKYANHQQRSEVNFVVGYFGTSWMQPATAAEELWRTAYRAGLESGDLFHTGCACCGTIMSYFMRGAPFQVIDEESERHLDFLERANLREPLGIIRCVRQGVRNLRGQTIGQNSLSDEQFDEAEFQNTLDRYGSRHFAHFYFILKMQLQYLWGDLAHARTTAHLAQRYLKDSTGMLHSAEHFFWKTLIELAAAGGSRKRHTSRGWEQVCARFHPWSASCPHNFLHKRWLLDAEAARVRGAVGNAVNGYEESRRAAQQFGYLQVEALACQRAASLLTAIGRLDEAAEWRSKACDAYRRWGATAYANALEQCDPELP